MPYFGVEEHPWLPAVSVWKPRFWPAIIIYNLKPSSNANWPHHLFATILCFIWRRRLKKSCLNTKSLGIMDMVHNIQYTGQKMYPFNGNKPRCQYLECHCLNMGWMWYGHPSHIENPYTWYVHFYYFLFDGFMTIPKYGRCGQISTTFHIVNGNWDLDSHDRNCDLGQLKNDRWQTIDTNPS